MLKVVGDHGRVGEDSIIAADMEALHPCWSLSVVL